MNPEGQRAVDYLLTYGWVILVVVIIPTILWQMGVFRGQPTQEELDLKEECKLLCEEHNLTFQSARLDYVFGSYHREKCECSAGALVETWIQSEDGLTFKRYSE